MGLTIPESSKMMRQNCLALPQAPATHPHPHPHTNNNDSDGDSVLEGRKEEQRDLKHVVAFRKVLFSYSIYLTHVKEKTIWSLEWLLPVILDGD